MIINERSNLLYVTFEKGDEIWKSLEEVVREYKIIEGKIEGFGNISRIEFGVLKTPEPLFFNKALKEEYLSISSLIGFVSDGKISASITGSDSKFNAFAGKLISATVEQYFKLTLDIFKTE